MQRKETLFVINEIAEMKNCNKCLFFEGRRNRYVRNINYLNINYFYHPF